MIVSIVSLKIIGVLESKGESTFGQDQDDVILYIQRTKRILAITHLESIGLPL
jgi:putative ABC transport system permease protein